MVAGGLDARRDPGRDCGGGRLGSERGLGRHMPDRRIHVAARGDIGARSGARSPARPDIDGTVGFGSRLVRFDVDGRRFFGSQRQRRPRHKVGDDPKPERHQAQQHDEDADDDGIDAQHVGDAGAHAARQRIAGSLPTPLCHHASSLARTASVKAASPHPPAQPYRPAAAVRYSSVADPPSPDASPSGASPASSGTAMRLTRMVEMRRRRMA